MIFYNANGNWFNVGASEVDISQATPIAGKRICVVGDSNIEYYADGHKAYMEDTYGCTFVPFGTAGATWHTRSDTEDAATLNNMTAVGKINKILANVDENGLITEYDYIVIMMGTNDWSVGQLGDTSADVNTTCGAMRYCLEKLCYHGRNIRIGVVLPIRNNSDTAMPTKSQNIQTIAHEYGVPVLDLYNEGRIIRDGLLPDASKVYLADSVHMSEYGQAQFRNILGKWIAYEL